MVRQVRGLGTLARTDDSGNLVAMVRLPDFMVRDVQLNQNATVGCHSQKAIFEAKGHVSHISPLSANGVRSVDIALDARLPDLVVADVQITGTIDIEKLDDVLYVGRPIHSTPNTSISVFKIVSDGTEAMRANVKFGRGSVQTIEVLDGLKAGDQIILSDMSNWDNVDRIHLK